MSSAFFFALVASALVATIVRAYPRPNLLGCRSIDVGSSYMGKPAVASTTGSLTITRGSTVLAAGAAYIPGETLNWAVTGLFAPVQYVVDASNVASISASGGFSFDCSGFGRHSNVNSGSVVMPSSGAAVEFALAWTTGKSTPVSINKNMILVAQMPSASSSGSSNDSSFPVYAIVIVSLLVCYTKSI